MLQPIARRIIQISKPQLYFSTMADTVKPKFSEGENSEQIMAEAASLMKSKWALDETQQGLEKTFNFPTYAKALVSSFLRHFIFAEIWKGLHTSCRGGD